MYIDCKCNDNFVSFLQYQYNLITVIIFIITLFNIFFQSESRSLTMDLF